MKFFKERNVDLISDRSYRQKRKNDSQYQIRIIVFLLLSLTSFSKGDIKQKNDIPYLEIRKEKNGMQSIILDPIKLPANAGGFTVSLQLIEIKSSRVISSIHFKPETFFGKTKKETFEFKVQFHPPKGYSYILKVDILSKGIKSLREHSIKL